MAANNGYSHTGSNILTPANGTATIANALNTFLNSASNGCLAVRTKETLEQRRGIRQHQGDHDGRLACAREPRRASRGWLRTPRLETSTRVEGGWLLTPRLAHADLVADPAPAGRGGGVVDARAELG